MAAAFVLITNNSLTIPSHKAENNFQPKHVLKSNDATEDIQYTPIFCPDDNGNVTLSDSEETSFNVYNELETQKEKYEDMKNVIDREQDLNKLINVTSKMSKVYEENITLYRPFNPNKPSTSMISTNVVPLVSVDIITSIAYFIHKNFTLAAELLTRSFMITEEEASQEKYTPINFNSIYSSKAAWNKLPSNDTNGHMTLGSFSLKENNLNEIDLALALHNVKYNTKGYLLTINDIYDFKPSNKEHSGNLFGALVDNINDTAYLAQQLHVLKNYEIEFTADFSQCLRISQLRKNGNSYNLIVTNITNNPIYFLYNSKMCFEGDAKHWRNLKDVNSKKLEKNGSTSITIFENGTATTFALCYILNDTKYITYLNELFHLENPKIQINQFHVKSSISKEIKFTALGTNKNQTSILIENLSSKSKKFRYSLNALSKDKYNDISYVNSQEFTLISNGYICLSLSNISTNNYILFRFFEEDKEEHIYITAIKTDYGSSLYSNCFEEVPIYNFLFLTNLGKENGKWKISVSNPLSISINVYYNEKMCFEDDGKYWTGLKDIKNKIVSANSSSLFYISTNFFATTITFSYIKDGVRLVTYANDLGNNGKISQKTMLIK